MPSRVVRLVAAGAATVALAAALAACTTSGAGQPPSVPAPPSVITSAPASTAPTAAVQNSTEPSTSKPAETTPSATKPSTTMPPTTSASSRGRAHPTAAHPRPSSSAHSTPSPSGQALPLRYPTGSARQVLTVVAAAESDTQATLQAWRRSASGWRMVGPAVPAWLGTNGMTEHPSEQNSATPMGSFTLTQAFGHDRNPGTALPYVHTTPADWWISEPGRLYNTLQHCSSGCDFARGDPNEHLYYETPYYDYAVVIDYNRAPVRQGAGSAFFLHVTVGAPTAGCVSIDKSRLVDILRWLRPGDHPRILIGTR